MAVSISTTPDCGVKASNENTSQFELLVSSQTLHANLASGSLTALCSAAATEKPSSAEKPRSNIALMHLTSRSDVAISAPTAGAIVTIAATPSRPSNQAITPAMFAFDALLIAVRAHIMAEFELNDADVWDPACYAWRDDADMTKMRMEQRIIEMSALTEALSGDRPLKRMAMLLDLMLGTSTRADLLHAHGLLTTHAKFFTCNEADPTAFRVNALLMRGRTLMSALVALPVHAELTESQADFDGQLSEFEDLDGFLTAA